jgi:hypothetical protein
MPPSNWPKLPPSYLPFASTKIKYVIAQWIALIMKDVGCSLIFAEASLLEKSQIKHLSPQKHLKQFTFVLFPSKLQGFLIWEKAALLEMEGFTHLQCTSLILSPLPKEGSNLQVKKLSNHAHSYSS